MSPESATATESVPTSSARASTPKASRPKSRRRFIFGTVGLSLIVVGLGAWGAWAQYQRGRRPAPVSQVEIVARYPHDRRAFTQGLTYDRDAEGRLWLFEGTGRYRRSAILRHPVDPTTGAPNGPDDPERLQQRLDANLFGEGIAIRGDRLYQLTWKERVGLIYDKTTLELIDEFGYRGQGWGLTYAPDTDRLIMSDGSAQLRFLDPSTLRPVGRPLRVTDAGREITNLNELEYQNGQIYANIYQTRYVVVVDPGTGRVLEWLDLLPLVESLTRDEYNALDPNSDVLNGIAFNPITGHLLVTGKYWPYLFEIRRVRQGQGVDRESE